MNEQDGLWQKVLDTSRRALASGSLVPIPTDCEYLEEAGVRFPVRVMATLRRKEEERSLQQKPGEGVQRNPFLPPEEDLFVSSLTETHLAVLNKFNVMENHLLIVTKEFEDQEVLLNERDFEALLICMRGCDGLGFYNGGEAAGASQRHKHLQLVPLPIAPEGPSVPIAPFLGEARFDGPVGTVPSFRFRHVYSLIKEEMRMPAPEQSRRIWNRFRMLLEKAGLNSPESGSQPRQKGPYCMLMTREWMLLVPRSREYFGSISINALGYCGSFFVKTEDELGLIRKSGPLEVLSAVGISEGRAG